MGKLVVTGGVIGLLMVIFGIVIDHVPGIVMQKSVPIVNRPQSKSFPGWKDPSLPIFMNFYFFNVTNVDEVMAGEKPVLEEKGPYVYREKREKVNITFNEDESEVSYNEAISFFFEPSKSVGSEDDVVSNYNLPFIGTVHALLEAKKAGNPKAGLAVLLLNGKVMANGITLFTFNTVKELLWGHTSAFFNQVWKNKRFKDKITTNQWGLFFGRNGTAGDRMTIGTGIHSLGDLAQVKAYKNEPNLKFWYSEYANMINGTDGSMFHPGVAKGEDLFMFSPDLCRSIMAEFKGEETIQGLKTYHYGPSESVFAAPEDNPDNADFCWPDGKSESCLGKGLLRVSACKKFAPLVASSPHLLGADAQKAATVEGLKPDPLIHVTKLNIEPSTGLLLEAKKRIQYNVLIQRIPRQGIFRKAADGTVLPLFWVEEGVEAPAEFAAKLAKVPKLLTMCHNLMLALVAVGAMLLMLCLLTVFVSTKKLHSSAPNLTPPKQTDGDKFGDVKYLPADK